MRLTAEEIAQACNGHVVIPAHPAHRECTGLSWDSRTVAEDDLYVALPGARVDGHTFCAAAIREGAAAVLVQNSLDAEIIDAARTQGSAVVRVEDTARAVRDIAAAWRARLSGRVIALSGSSGKTSTKNLVRDVLASALSVVATQANQNNELGVPATLLRAEEDTAVVVVEMGMRGLGQLEDLCTFVKPDVALVTNVGTSHIELLGSRDNIARAKAEVYQALPAGGVAIINAADTYAAWMHEHAQLAARGVRTVFFDGYHEGLPSKDLAGVLEAAPFVYARNTTFNAAGCATFTLCSAGFGMPSGQVPVTLAMPGAHSVSNACAAAAVGLVCGMTLQQIAHALERALAEAGRNNVIVAPGGFTVIDDAYNANPDSMRASLTAFSRMQAQGRRVAVLGDMGELGEYSLQGHTEVGELAAQVGIDTLVCVGQLAIQIATAAQGSGMPAAHITCVSDAQAALAALDAQDIPSPGDLILVKASHSVGLEKVVERLVAHA